MKKRISTIMNWREKSSPLRSGVNVMTYLHVIFNTVCSSAATYVHLVTVHLMVWCLSVELVPIVCSLCKFIYIYIYIYFLILIIIIVLVTVRNLYFVCNERWHRSPSLCCNLEVCT